MKERLVTLHIRQDAAHRCQDAELLKKYVNGTALTDKEEKRAFQLADDRYKKNAMQRKRNRKHASDIEYASWKKEFLNKRWQDYINSVLKGEEGNTYDAIGDVAYCEHVVELENKYDLDFSIMDAPVEGMEDVYNLMLDCQDVLRYAVAALQKSEQQRKRKHKDKAFLDDYFKGASMTAYEEEKGKRLVYARHRKNQKQHEHNRRYAEDCDYWSWREGFLKKKKNDFMSSFLRGGGENEYDYDISFPVNEFDLEEEYESELDHRDAMRASA